MKKLPIIPLILLFIVVLFASCKKEDQEQPLAGTPLDFKELRSLSVPNLSVIDSAETTKVIFNGQEIYFYRWQLGYENSHNVPGRLEYAESGKRQFLLVGTEIGFSTLFFIRNDSLRSQLPVLICVIKKAEIISPNYTEYLNIRYNNQWTGQQNPMPDETIQVYLPGAWWLT